LKIKKLTLKQLAFTREYLIDLNATQAAIRAGYSERSAQQVGASNMLKHVIQEAIQEAMDKRAEKIGISADWVLNNLKEVAERCMQAVPVMEFDHDDKCMKETGEYKFEHTGANKSLELIGRHLKMFTDKVDLTSKGKDLYADITFIPVNNKTFVPGNNKD